MSYDHWKTSNPDDQYLGPEPWEVAQAEAEEQIAKAAVEWRKKWPCACKACGGWGGSSYTEMHGFTYGSGEQMFDPCEALGPEFCHRCGYEGFDEDHEGLRVERRDDDTKAGWYPQRCCFWCGHADDDGEPQL